MVVTKILPCPRCGAGKTRSTHSFGVYRVYEVAQTLILRCKTCGFKQRYKYIKGGFTYGDD